LRRKFVSIFFFPRKFVKNACLLAEIDEEGVGRRVGGPEALKDGCRRAVAALEEGLAGHNLAWENEKYIFEFISKNKFQMNIIFKIHFLVSKSFLNLFIYILFILYDHYYDLE
jgi:hypothetical protein